MRTRSAPVGILLAAGLVAACGPAQHVPAEASAEPAPAAPGAPFVGPDACLPCHEDKVRAFERSAHRNTSALPSDATILGSFEPGANTLITGGGRTRFTMERRGGAFFQAATMERDRSETVRRFDVVFGSGKLGQTYAYWSGSELYQLPVSYLASEDAWMNSPGERYADGTADFTRPIVPECVECHTTWIQHEPGTLNTYRPETLVPGVTCERCHGPAGEHVRHHRAHPGALAAHAIVHPADLPRERALDLCGQCHGGVGNLLRPPFTYRPGEPLAEHLEQPPPPEPGAEGVHSSNQLPRLRLSRCFQASPSLSCATCHDPHVVERGRTREFSARCLSCHQVEQCGAAHGAAAAADPAGPPADPAGNCIDCHMPLIPSASTTIRSGGDVLRPPVRDHRIAVPGR